jgi:membrane protein DedA with SNARE-associated domain
MVASVVGLAILAIAAVLIGYATSTNDGTGIWQIVDLIPGIALPIGFLLIIALLVITFVRRSQAAKDDGK